MGFGTSWRRAIKTQQQVWWLPATKTEPPLHLAEMDMGYPMYIISVPSLVELDRMEPHQDMLKNELVQTGFLR